MKIKQVLIPMLSLSFILLSFQSVIAQSEEDVVKEVISKGYINGAFNALDADAMRKTFHEDFAIFSAKGETISKYPISTWAEGVEKRKNSDDFDPKKNVWEHEFVSVDITGGAAAVKIKLFKEGKHVYTDYLSLLKFENGWRVVAKVYHHHK